MNLIEKIFILKNEPVFASLSNSELILVANIAKVRKYSKSSIIVQQNSPIQNLFILKNNGASCGEKIISKCFGAEEMLNDILPEKDIVAKEDVVAILITKGYFYTLIYECPSFIVDLIKRFDQNRINQ